MWQRLREWKRKIFNEVGLAFDKIERRQGVLTVLAAFVAAWPKR
ncbi:hypothetical protein [Streptomyces orinoci]|uniref:Transposase n=1 Tax=Streptomyces orinoci TaxID=67339 RepID=A0ABV3K5N0_STRON|nr:hypothetical protein [Streptomyces orinoci]